MNDTIWIVVLLSPMCIGIIALIIDSYFGYRERIFLMRKRELYYKELELQEEGDNYIKDVTPKEKKM